MLLDSNSGPIVVILGKPGSGKSTLLWDAIYNSRLQNNSYRIYTEEFSFYPRVVSPNKDVKWLIVVDDRSDVDNIKFLLSADEGTLLNLNIFKFIGKGSKIVIISSLDLDYTGSSKISFPSLDEVESWSLFQKTACIDRESPLLSIGYKICQKCERIPGVINIVASILSSKSTIEEWEHFLHVIMTSVPDPITTISSTIEFTKRPSDDKRFWGHCFAWCSLLPKEYEFRKDRLFHLWKGQEYFPLENEQIASIHENRLDYCFNEFLRRGYFLKSDIVGSKVSYKINHLVFELMKYVAGDDFCLVDQTTPEPNHKIIRHASFVVDPSWKPPSWLLKAKQLQSLLLWPRNSCELFPLSKIDMTLAGMTQLRTFYAEIKHCELYPAFLAELKRLKYLRLGLLSSISLPKDIPALQKLLNIDIRHISTKHFEPNGIHSLTDCKFGEEERLALLITSTACKMTVQYESFNERNLEQTNKILESLNFQSTAFHEDDWRFASLNPHQSLESLLVCRWKGEMLPAWINESSVFLRSLLSIQISNCGGCQHLPGFNTLPLLSSLHLGSLPSLIDIRISAHDSEVCSEKSVYPSLKCLVLCALPELKGWLSKDLDHKILQLYYFPVLTEVRIQGCPKLKFMPSVPKLESLGAINIDFKMLPDLMFSVMIETSEHQHLSHVKNLEIDGCKEFNWGDKPDGGEKGAWHAIKSLHYMKLSNITELTSLPMNQRFMTLKQLSLCWLANLKVLPEWIGQLTQLHHLTIYYCPKLTFLPNSEGSFSALEQLEIRYCPRVSQFPESLPKLKTLQVQDFCRLEQILCVSRSLEELEINNCDELEWETPSITGEVSVNVWERLNCLHSLKLTKMDTYPKGLDFTKLTKLSRLDIERCPKLTYLPETLCSLSTLVHLRIHYYPGLINLPDNLKNLRYLKKLEIQATPQLEKRCKPDGQDWSLIKHIRDIVINNSP